MWAGGTSFTDQRSVSIKAGPHAVFKAICRIGGGNGWYAGDILWRIRGWMDNLVGGPGLRRGRRDSERVEFGEALDFWRVVGIERDRSLSLRAEMKLPGEAMLNFELEADEHLESTKLTMTARYRPRGVFGILYWYAVVPLHNLVFGGMLKGISNTAEAMQRAENASAPSPLAGDGRSRGYGRARLWLGISAVGSLVTLCTLGLSFDIARMVQQRVDSDTLGTLAALLLFVLAHAAIQLPFDLFGGYLLPRHFGRSHLPLGSYLLGLARGVAAHSTLLFFAAVTILLAGRFGGLAGVAAAGLVLILLLLVGRVAIASLMARLELTPSQPTSSSADHLPIYVARSRDEGFTGGVLGVLKPQAYVLPEKWSEVLGPEELEVVVTRRSLAVKTGSWMRGRAMALVFTIVGLVLAAWLVGPSDLGTAGGTIAFSLWFTLWSFVGLLLLPTFSRRGVIEVDELAHAEGCASEAFCTATRVLNDLQDGETDRSSLVETVFHPIPSVRNRFAGPRIHGGIGFWDAARTAVYLGMAGLSLLGRAVHCNCGRPSLWVFLPTD